MLRHLAATLIGFACFTPLVQAQTYEDLKVVATDGAAGDRFAWSVGTSGGTGVIGAHWDDDQGEASGSAYVFDVSTGQELFKLNSSDGMAGDYFGSSVAVGGNVAVIGARGDDDNGSLSGSAYVFDVTTGQELFKLNASDGAEGDYFGIAVAVSGSIAVIGARLDDDNGPDSGSAYVFSLPPEGVSRYCGTNQNPNNAAVIDIDTTDSSAASIRVSLASAPANQFAYLLVGNGSGTVSRVPRGTSVWSAGPASAATTGTSARSPLRALSPPTSRTPCRTPAPVRSRSRPEPPGTSSTGTASRWASPRPSPTPSRSRSSSRLPRIVTCDPRSIRTGRRPGFVSPWSLRIRS